jgi:hypothetical protein
MKKEKKKMWDFKEAERLMRKLSGRRARDRYDLPISEKKFPDGANARIEISGMEGLKVFEATIEEALDLDVPIHKVIFDVGGAAHRTLEELIEVVKLANKYEIEVIVVPEPRPTGDIGRQAATPEGIISGLRLRGMEMVRDHLADIRKHINLGYRGFLVWDEGVLAGLSEMRSRPDIPEIPADLTFKISIFAGAANPWDVLLLERLGANTVNPVADLTLPQLASIRQTVDIPLDVHVFLWKSMGGFNQLFRVGELGKIVSPVYFKIEPGPDFGMYGSWSEDQLAECGRQKVRIARNIIDLIEDQSPDVRISRWGPKDLRVPVPQEKEV